MKIFEFIMLACFGVSWPISVYKSLKSHSTQGKSVVFIVAIIVGYISGIIGKIVNNDISYVLVVYCFNLLIVSIDLILFFINRNHERKEKNRLFKEIIMTDL
ncbi:MAG: hypothetical protein IJX87_04280 [Clostridia bacterium]|nr:hypothetical protein [Clostridia bacterium]